MMDQGIDLVDFDVNGDVNDELTGESIDADDRNFDEADIDESSMEGEQGHEVKLFDHCSSKDIMPNFGPEDEPYVGQEFESEAAAHAFYNSYATNMGFIIRVSKLSRSRRDGSAIGRALVCNKEGYRTPDKREKVMRQRVETRVGCRAMILVRKVSSGKWIVTKFVKEHTHPLSPGKVRKDFIFDQFPNEHDKIRELSQLLAIEKKRSATYKRHLEMLFEHIEEHNQSLSTKIQHIVDDVREIERTHKPVNQSL
ncbi:hypothetical protein Droror1_Dr00025872 [Drosera rotundifolia]